MRAQGTESKLNKLRDEILANLGGMDLDARIEAERTFRNEAQIMVATEAAGEGINLQFCSMMVNYDIPWNPNRLEQRMGRIHRYGQDREVFIWNLIAKDTREGQILERLFEKLELMKDALGTDRVFDIIGEVIPGSNLGDLLKDAIFNQRRMEDIEQQIEQVSVRATSETLERVFLSSLATRHIDYTGLLRQQLEAQENRLVPEYVQDYFLRGFAKLGGRFSEIEKGYRIEHVPLELRGLNQDLGFKTRYGTLHREYRRVTFEKAVARHDTTYEFVAPGHPLLEALNEVILGTFKKESTQYAAFTDPTNVRQGALWFVEGVVRDGSGTEAGRRVFCVLETPEGEMRTLNPAVLWDLEPVAEADVPEGILERMTDRSAIEDHLVEAVLFPYRTEIEERRKRDVQVKERYGLKSLDYLIQESNEKLLEYEMRSAGGEDMEIATRNERRNLERLEHRRGELVREIRLEGNVTVDEPRILAEKERRSLNQQAILLLERALEEQRPSFMEAHEAYVQKYGPPPFDDDFFEGLRSLEMGRSSPFEDEEGG